MQSDIDQAAAMRGMLSPVVRDRKEQTFHLVHEHSAPFVAANDEWHSPTKNPTHVHGTFRNIRGHKP